METKSDIGWMEYVHDQCEFKNGLFVPSDGATSGLALLWRKEVTVHIHNYSSSHIDAFVDGGVDGWWHLTGFYGNPKTSRYYESWSCLNLLVIIHNYHGLLLVILMNWWVYLKRKVELLDLQVRWNALRKSLMFVDLRTLASLVLDLLGYIRNLMVHRFKKGFLKPIYLYIYYY